MKKRPPTQDGTSKQLTIFCTECGAELENFCFTSSANDVDAIKKRLAQCKKEGRFRGEFCAKFFVAHPGEMGSFGMGDSTSD